MSAAPAGRTPRVRLFVHVGEGKTGSSAIQRMLYQEQEHLAAAGVRYLGLMLDKNTTREFPWQHVERIEQFHRLPADQAVRELSSVLAAAVDAAAKDGVHTLVWSNESLCKRSATTIAALRAIDAATVEPVIVAYVRRRDRWAQSAYLQWGIKHKTYPGPLQDFATWAKRQDFTLAPRLRRWREAFGDRALVRNYDAIEDVTSDFAGVIGLDGRRFGGVRRNQALPPAELALRAAYNQRSEGNVRPKRFNDLFGSETIDFSLPLGAWLRGLLPDEAALRSLREQGAADDREVAALLAASGQPPFDDAPTVVPPFELDGDAVVGALVQMVAVQAERLEALEQRVAALSAGAQGAVPARAGPAGGSAAAPAPTAAGLPTGDPPPPVAKALAPALGYFGALPSDSLEVRLDRPVTAIRLALDEPRPVFLNLRGLELLKDGAALALPEDAWQARQSSTTGEDAANGAGNLLRSRGIHSGAEQAPWWEVRFAVPVEADTLRLHNRTDGWGRRSRTLRIDVTGTDGRVHRVHDGQSSGLLAACVAEAARAAGIPPVPALPVDVPAAARLRKHLLSRIAARLRSKALPLQQVRWPMVLPLVDAWNQLDDPTPDEWTVLAGFLLAQHQGKRGTSIRAFSFLLDRRSRLLALQSELNRLAAAVGLGRYMLTRHGVKAEGMLRREPQKFLAHLQAVMRGLGSLDRAPVLAYGTLLGAVRDGDFIAHDDDVDVMYRSGATSRAAVEADLLRVKEALRGQGFRVDDLLPNSLNLHVIDPRTGAVIDAFPCWMEGGRLQMHMESLAVRGIDPAILYPPSTLQFLGATYAAPADPEAFLAERYGDGWRVADPFYEWPWPLKQEADA